MATSSLNANGVTPGGATYATLHGTKVSYNSPYDAHGNLVLRPNNFSLRRNDCSVQTELWKPPRTNSGFSPWSARILNLPDFPEELVQSARSKMYAATQGQNAAVGMTLMTFGQTRDMIASRATKMLRKTEKMDEKIKREQRSGRFTRRDTRLADDWLEYYYGWSPFIGDIHDALKTVSSYTPDTSWVSGRASAPAHERTRSVYNEVITEVTFGGNFSCTYNVRAWVSNPNLWMQNRMGLINPATVAWDMVPWSFVVNMFSNANSLVNSLSEEIGLGVDYQNTTKTTRVTRVHSQRTTDGSRVMVDVTKMVRKNRELGALPLDLVVRVPDFSWETAVTACALLGQRVNKLNSALDRWFRAR